MPRYTVELIHTTRDINARLEHLPCMNAEEAIVKARITLAAPNMWVVATVTDEDHNVIVYDSESSG
jgi:hypothetical protein